MEYQSQTIELQHIPSISFRLAQFCVHISINLAEGKDVEAWKEHAYAQCYAVVILFFSPQNQRTQFFPIIIPESGSEAHFTPGHLLTAHWNSHWFSR